jgi:hypothetical protein
MSAAEQSAVLPEGRGFIDFERHEGGKPNPYTREQKIDVQYSNGDFAFDMPGTYHGAYLWEHTDGNPRNWIVASRAASNPFHRDGAFSREELA